MMLILITTLPIGLSEQSTDTELEITAINSGFAQVIVDVKNIGTEVAEEIQIAIGVKGGLFDKIELLHVCGGCSHCGTTLDPGATKTESTKERGLILGIGPITVNVSASAINAPEINTDTTGFVIGPFVIIQ